METEIRKRNLMFMGLPESLESTPGMLDGIMRYILGLKDGEPTPEIESQRCTPRTRFVNIYAPNTAQSTFLSKLNLLLAEFADYPILMAGDFNLVSNAIVDRSGRPLPVDGTLSSALKEVRF